MQCLAVEPQIRVQLERSPSRVRDKRSKNKGRLACSKIDRRQGWRRTQVDHGLRVRHAWPLPHGDRRASFYSGSIDRVDLPVEFHSAEPPIPFLPRHPVRPYRNYPLWAIILVFVL